MTHEEFIRAVLARKGDPHTAWAAHCLNKPESEVTREERAAAKTNNYYLLYNPAFLASIPRSPS